MLSLLTSTLGQTSSSTKRLHRTLQPHAVMASELKSPQEGSTKMSKTNRRAIGLTNSNDRQYLIQRLTETILWYETEGSRRQPKTSLRQFNSTLQYPIPPETQVFAVCLDRCAGRCLRARRSASPRCSRLRGDVAVLDVHLGDAELDFSTLSF